MTSNSNYQDKFKNIEEIVRIITKHINVKFKGTGDLQSKSLDTSEYQW